MDHAPQGNPGAPAPISTEDRTAALAQSLLSESEDNPNAWSDEEQPEAPPQEGEASEAPTETEEQPAAEEATPAEELEEIEYAEGKTYKVPKELKRGWLREDDYTRKTQKLAEGFKTVDGSMQQLSQTAQALQGVAPLIGQLTNLDMQMHQIEQQLADPRLAQEDPLMIGQLSARLQLLDRQRNQVAQRVSAEQQRIVQAMDQVQSQTVRARMEHEMPILEAAFKDFNPDKHGKEASEYLKKSGIAPEALGFINHSPAALALVLKARAYDQLQADKKTSLKKVENLPPVAKPGQRTSSADGDVNLKKLSDANRKAGGKDPDIRRALLREQLFGRR